MRKFRFRLQKVLDYRTKMEEQAYNRLQEAIRKRLQHENTIRVMKSEWRSAASQASSGQTEEWQQRETYLAALQWRIAEMEEALPFYLQAEVHAREAYLEVRRARESLSKLYERAYTHYRKELESENQKMLDEWARRS
jgi:flagellar export protein FliJ